MKLSWNKFKLHCYKFRTFIVIPMETTEKLSKRYTKANEEAKMARYKKLSAKEEFHLFFTSTRCGLTTKKT